MANVFHSKNVDVPPSTRRRSVSPFGNVTSPPLHPMPFGQHLQLVLDPARPLPLHIDLGYYSCSWDNREFELQSGRGREQQGFRQLTRDELMQLMRRLQANPHVILLNLMHQGIHGAAMQEISASISALSELQVLVLYGACPTSPLSLSMAGLQQQHNHHRLLHHSSPSIPHTFQPTASAPRVALRFRHLWVICRIWKYWISGVRFFDTGCSCCDVAFWC
jgi:hypothetical protein